jgi:hypothetical protein
VLTEWVTKTDPDTGEIRQVLVARHRYHDLRQHADSRIMPTTPQGQGVGGARVVSGFGIIRGSPRRPAVCHQGGIVWI